jgi:hypothetical protein
MKKIKFNAKFVIFTLIVTLVIIPFLFNLLFIGESKWNNGETSDWFTLYGNIFGGLIGGFFTYLALLLTINEQKEDKRNEMRPQMDIPHQSINFIDSDNDLSDVVIELNNIGGSIAKNIECTLVLQSFEKVISALNENKSQFGIVDELITVPDDMDEFLDIKNKVRKSVTILVKNKQNHKSTFIGNVYNEHGSEFLGSCIPLVLNHEAKTKYILRYGIHELINHVVKNRSYTFNGFKKEELFNFNLEVKYSSFNEDFHDIFKLEWEHIGIYSSSDILQFQYVLKSTKIS